MMLCANSFLPVSAGHGEGDHAQHGGGRRAASGALAALAPPSTFGRHLPLKGEEFIHLASINGSRATAAGIGRQLSAPILDRAQQPQLGPCCRRRC